MKSQQDGMILESNHARSLIRKVWHDLCRNNDTPSGLMECRIHIYNPFTPSEFCSDTV